MKSDHEDPLGFYRATTGAHMARSMMLQELTLLLSGTSEQASRAAIQKAVVEDNLLGKPTASSREKTFQHLRRAYGLETNTVLWRTLRQFAKREPRAMPLIALVLVYSRDAQLRASFELVNTLKVGEELPRVRMEQCLEQAFPNKYSKAMKTSTAQNVNTTWTVTGHLEGHSHKHRARPRTHWLATTYAMFVGYLAGIRGQVLLDSVYARLVGVDPLTAADHLSSASAQGLIRFRNAGGVVETDFSNLLQPADQLLLHGAH
jgi:hypothetical protein